MIRIDCKGDPVLRIRQIKVTGELKSESPRILQMPSSFVLQQRQCESETLKVFRLIIFQVPIPSNFFKVIRFNFNEFPKNLRFYIST